MKKKTVPAASKMKSMTEITMQKIMQTEQFLFLISLWSDFVPDFIA